MQTVRDIVIHAIKETVSTLVEEGQLENYSHIETLRITNKILRSKDVLKYKRRALEASKKNWQKKVRIKTSLSPIDIHIAQIICNIHHIDYEDLLGAYRTNALVDARRHLSSFFYNYMSYTYTYIGNLLGKDHSTIIHYLRTHDDLLRYDSVYSNKFLRFITMTQIELPTIFTDIEKKTDNLRDYYKIKNQRDAKKTAKDKVN